VQDRAQWEFFAGHDRGRARWSKDITQKAAVLDDPRREYPTLRGGGASNLSVISQGGVVYNAPLRRYLYTSWTQYTFEFYESPTPWGPWKLFLHHDAGGRPWYGNQDGHPNPGPKNAGYGTTIPSKFISTDGLSMWVQSNYFLGGAVGRNDYQLNLRRLHVTPARRSAPERRASFDNLARSDGVTPVEKSAHWPIHSTGAAVVPVGPRAGAHYPGSTGGLQARFRTDSDCVEPPSTRGYPPSLERPPAGRPWRASDQHYSG